jgi:hypothetical protein
MIFWVTIKADREATYQNHQITSKSSPPRKTKKNRNSNYDYTHPKNIFFFSILAIF